ncbi:MAG: hypothetical protein BWY95_02187 [Bacteroidetes bacterium ADurb.BinA104]|nr:MAG: hypothetical protein BWY95_02187 [Bacteroidetes bacterium ADurb.BinA104]
MFLESFTDGNSSLIGIQIIFPFTKRQTALPDAYQIVLAVHHISSYPQIEISACQTVQIELYHQWKYLLALPDSLNLINPGFKRSQPLIVTACRIKHQFIEIGYLLCISAKLIVRGHYVVNKILELLTILFGQLIKTAKTRILVS